MILPKKFGLIALVLLLLSNLALAGTECFIARENHKILKQEGHCDLAHSPYSTFKVAISLMGYDEGILQDATHPEWPYKDGYLDWMAVWKQPQNPTTWIKNSVVWYSQLITKALGMEKFRHYVHAFHYGNEDIVGDPGKDNGLTEAWLGSSLQISGFEQVAFLEQFLQGKLPVSKKASKMTKTLLFIEDLGDGWRLYGKTGSGTEKDRPAAWFIGWIEHNNRQIVFAHFYTGEDQLTVPISATARDLAVGKLVGLIRSQINDF
jgi:beta-lactamase class D